MNSELDRVYIRVHDATLTGVGTTSWLGFPVSCNPRGEKLRLTLAVFGHSRNNPLVGGSETGSLQGFIVYQAL